MFFNQQTSLQHTEEKNQHKPEIKQRLRNTNFFEKHVPGTCIQSEICPTKYTYYNHTFDWSNLLRNKIMMVSIVRVSFLKPLIPVTRHNQRNPRRPTLCKSPRVCAPGVEEVTMTSYQTSWFHLPSPNRQTAFRWISTWLNVAAKGIEILRLPWIAKSVSIMQSHSHARARTGMRVWGVFSSVIVACTHDRRTMTTGTCRKNLWRTRMQKRF